LLAAYALNPKDPVALTELSRAFFADGRYAQAAQYAQEAIEVDPANPRLHGNLGIVHYKNGDFEAAIPELALAVRGGLTEGGSGSGSGSPDIREGRRILLVLRFFIGSRISLRRGRSQSFRNSWSVFLTMKLQFLTATKDWLCANRVSTNHSQRQLRLKK